MAVATDGRVRSPMRVFSRWRRSDGSRRRELTAISLNLVPLLVAAAGFALLAPASDWSQPVLIAALAAASAIAFAAEARLKAANRAFFGANLVIALVALDIAGPVPALIVWLVPDLITRFVLGTEQKLSPGFVANVGSYALAVLVGAELLELAGSPSGTAVAPALYACGVAMWATNFCFARLTFAPFYQGYRPAALIRDEFAALGPAVLGMLVVGVVAALLVDAIGVLALAPLASGDPRPPGCAGAARRLRARRPSSIASRRRGSTPPRSATCSRCRAPSAARSPARRTSSTGRTGPRRPSSPRPRRRRSSPCTRTSAGRAAAGPPACRPRRSRGAAASSRSPTPGPP